MKLTSFYIPSKLKTQAAKKAKAVAVPFARIIRALIRMWESGEIEIDWEKWGDK